LYFLSGDLDFLVLGFDFLALGLGFLSPDLEIRAWPRSGRLSAPGPDLIAPLDRMGYDFISGNIAYCRTSHERLCFVRDLFKAYRDS
jgi:hypothetical protein